MPEDFEYAHGGLPGLFTWPGVSAVLVALVLVAGAIFVAYRFYVVRDQTMTVRLQPRNVARGELFTVIVEPGGDWICDWPSFSLGAMGGQTIEFVALRDSTATRTQHVVPDTAPLGEFVVRVECRNGERSGTGEGRGTVVRKPPPGSATPPP